MYRDLLIEEPEYRQTKEKIQIRLASLTLPENQELIEAGNYLKSLAPLWKKASIEEQREITRVMIQAVYIDVNRGKILQVHPNPPFATLLGEVCEEINVEIIK